MNLRSEYGNPMVDDLLCYFMKTILRIRKYGAARIPIDVAFGEPVDGYLKTAVDLMEDAQVPETTDIILQIELGRILAEQKPSREQLTALILIKELTMHIRFDEDPSDYLLSTSSLWNNKVNEYACRTFYCNLPPEILKKQGMDEILALIPPEQLKRDDF